MKQIILTIFLLSNIYAQTTQKDICQFKKVIKNGWNENNQTLNQKIIDLKKNEVPRIIGKLHTPIIADENTSAIITIPKIQLRPDDYIILMSYTKYLEANNKILDSSKIYTDAFEGLFNTKDNSMIAAIFKLAINNVLTQSINQSLKSKIFSPENKLSLYINLSKLLILDNYYLIAGIQSEKRINFQLINQMKYNKNYLIIYKQEFTKINSEYWDVLIRAIKNDSLSETKKREDKRLSSLLFWNKIKLFFLNQKVNIYKKLSIPINKKDYIQHAKYSAIKTLLVTRPNFYEICQDYLNMINNNKKLLLKLKENQ